MTAELDRRCPLVHPALAQSLYGDLALREFGDLILLRRQTLRPGDTPGWL